ncbi:MAG: ACT domain-containing protein, partial [Janthinobacterium lividum]
GVSIHRSNCPSFARLQARAPERVVKTEWPADALGAADTVYPVDLAIEASDRQGLLRDISEVFAREKINVIGVKTSTQRDVAYMQFTVEVSDASRVQRAIAVLTDVRGVMNAKRKA